MFALLTQRVHIVHNRFDTAVLKEYIFTGNGVQVRKGKRMRMLIFKIGYGLCIGIVGLVFAVVLYLFFINGKDIPLNVLKMHKAWCEMHLAATSRPTSIPSY